MDEPEIEKLCKELDKVVHKYGFYCIDKITIVSFVNSNLAKTDYDRNIDVGHII